MDDFDDDGGCGWCVFYLTPWSCNGGTDEFPCMNAEPEAYAAFLEANPDYFDE